MFDRTQADDFKHRLGIAAIGYYPSREQREPGYTIDEDIAFCLDALPDIPDLYRQRMQARIAEVITDPTAHREQFLTELFALVPD